MSDNQQQERKTWKMIKKANPTAAYVKGAGAIWVGENGLNENNQWVDIINKHTFTPISSTIVPVYNSELKLLDFNQYGGMKSSFSLPATSETPYTIELVLRDMDLSSSMGDNWGKLLGPEMSEWYNKARTFAITGYWNNTKLPEEYRNSYSLDYYNANYQPTAVRSSISRQPGVTTITAIPTKGLWVNGQKGDECNLDCDTTQFGLASAIGGKSSYSNTKIKVHSVRYYPFELTSDEIINNYNVDIAKYA